MRPLPNACSTRTLSFTAAWLDALADLVGPNSRKGQPDRRAWLLSRVVEAESDGDDAVTGVTALPSATAAGEMKRAPGFVACIDAEATVMSRLELPSW